MNILLLGNGFDAHYNLPTNYISFLHTLEYIKESRPSFIGSTVGCIFGNGRLQARDSYIERSYTKYKSVYNKTEIPEEVISELFNLANNNLWCAYFLKALNSDVGWIDVEREIAEVVRSFSELLSSSNITIVPQNRFSNDVSKRIVKEFGFWIRPHSSSSLPTGSWRVKDEFVEEYPVGSKLYQINKKSIVDKLVQELTELSNGLRLYLKYFINIPATIMKEKGLIQCDELFLDSDIIITFNYTSTYETLTHSEKVHHIHGNVDNQIVLGINPDDADKIDTINTTFIEFKKYYQRAKLGTDNEYIRWINTAKRQNQQVNLLVMGHSLDKTDNDILAQVFELADEITIICRNEASIGKYINNLVLQFGRERFLELRDTKALSFSLVNSDLTPVINRRRENSEQAFLENLKTIYAATR